MGMGTARILPKAAGGAVQLAHKLALKPCL
jgi:hypothetical protein